jgi:hypothetical protein
MTGVLFVLITTFLASAVAAAVAVGLILTAILNNAHITAWWLVPLIVIFMLGLSLRRASKA